MQKKKLQDLRSQRWFGATDLRSFGHRSRTLQMGYAREDFLSGPCNEGPLALIDSWPDWPGRAIVLVGPEGSGKRWRAASR